MTLLSLVLLVAWTARAEEPAALLHSAPTRAEAHRPLRLEGTLVDGARRLSELVIRYRGPGEPYTETALERQYGDLYRGAIPAEHMVPPGVEYYVEGILKGGERVPLFHTGARPARVLVAGELPRSRPAVAEAREPPPPPPPAPPAKPAARKRGAEPESEVPSTPRPTAKASGAEDDALAALSAELPEDEAAPAPAPRGGGRGKSPVASSPRSSASPPSPLPSDGSSCVRPALAPWRMCWIWCPGSR